MDGEWIDDIPTLNVRRRQRECVAFNRDVIHPYLFNFAKEH